MLKKKINVAFIDYISFPSKTAHGLLIAEMANALNKHTYIDLIIPTTQSRKYIKIALKLFYDIEIDNIHTIKVPLFKSSFNFLPYKKINSLRFIFRNFYFSIASLLYILKNNRKYDIIYTTSPYIAFFFSFFKRVVYDAHGLYRYGLYRLLHRFFMKRITLLVVPSPYLCTAYKYIYNFDIPCIYLPNGINIEKFEKHYKNPDCKIIKNFKNNPRKTSIAYIGTIENISSSKIDILRDIDKILEVAKTLREADFHLIGFKDEITYKYFKEIIDKNKIDNVYIHKRIPHNKVISIMGCFDAFILLLGESIHTKYFACPMKTFEYMYSGKCIIAVDYPSIRSILDNDSAIFFEGSDINSLKKAIEYILKNPNKCKNKGINAKKRVIDRYTWDIRARKLLERIEVMLR